MALTFHAGDFESPDVQALLAMHYGIMRSISPHRACHVLPLDGLKDPAITFWAARDDGQLAGVGALKELAADHGEVKSMRTAPRSMGRGVGRAVLNHIVREARSRGYKRLSLETGGTQPFAAAISLYESEGFEPCGPFAGYENTSFSRFFSREL
jgi:putative acetyltransferase